MDILGPRYVWLILDDHQQLKRDAVASLLREGDNVAILRKTHHAQLVSEDLASSEFTKDISMLLAGVLSSF